MRCVWIAAFAAMLLAQGCASITTGGSQNVSVEAKAANQAVTGASCQLTNDKGSWSIVTPGTVSVRGSYGDLSVRCESEQFEPGIASFKSTTKAMAFGNILVGGLIGATIDVASGAAYQYPSLLTVALGVPTGKPPAPAAVSPLTSALRGMQTGDMWEYTIEDRYSGATRTVRWTVDGVKEGKVTMNGGTRTEGVDGRSVVTTSAGAGDLDSFEPPQGWGQPALQVGNAWHLSYEAVDGAPRSAVETQARVVRREVVQTPAGRFDTFVVQHEGSAHRHSGTTTLPHQAKFTVWIDEASGRVVKFESEVFASSGSQPARISRERAQLNAVRRAAGAS